MGGREGLGLSFGAAMLATMLLIACAQLVESAAAHAHTAALQRPNSPGGPTKPFSESGISGIDFRYPADWDAEPVRSSIPFPFATPIVYLSNEQLHPPCIVTSTTPTFAETCGSPLSRLSRGSILASWWEGGRPNWTFPQDAPGTPLRVAGHRAKLRITRSSCGIGADEMVDVIINRPDAPGNWFEFRGCIKGPGIRRRERQVMALLKTTHFGRFQLTMP